MAKRISFTLIGHPAKTYFLPSEVNTNVAYAEERRVFYVALTRAKRQVYMVGKEMDVSPFVTELLGERTDGLSNAKYHAQILNSEDNPTDF